MSINQLIVLSLRGLIVTDEQANMEALHKHMMISDHPRGEQRCKLAALIGVKLRIDCTEAKLRVNQLIDCSLALWIDQHLINIAGN